MQVGGGSSSSPTTSSTSAPSPTAAPEIVPPSVPEGSQEEGELGEAVADGVRQPRVATVPKPPTKKQMEEHLPLYIPYEARCDICFRSAGNHDSRNSHHGELALDGPPTISFDYCFITF